MQFPGKRTNLNECRFVIIDPETAGHIDLAGHKEDPCLEKAQADSGSQGEIAEARAGRGIHRRGLRTVWLATALKKRGAKLEQFLIRKK